MSFSKQIAIAVSALSLVGAGAAQAGDNILNYTFDSGTFYDFDGGASNTVTGSFTLDTTTEILSNVDYHRGDDHFTTGVVGGPKELYFGDTGSSDYDVYEFKNDLAGGGTDMIVSATHPAIVIDAGGSITSGAGGVPEPASWALMMVGFGLVGGAMRSRKAGAALRQA